MVKVADDFPRTTQAAVALMSAADAAFAGKDYPGAMKAYQRVTDTAATPAELRDSAQLGLASVQETSGKSDDAIQSYLEVAHKDSRSAFAPVAYYQAARICEDRKDKPAEMRILQDAVRLGSDSPFVKQAASMLKELQPAPAPSAGRAIHRKHPRTSRDDPRGAAVAASLLPVAAVYDRRASCLPSGIPATVHGPPLQEGVLDIQIAHVEGIVPR